MRLSHQDPSFRHSQETNSFVLNHCLYHQNCLVCPCVPTLEIFDHACCYLCLFDIVYDGSENNDLQLSSCVLAVSLTLSPHRAHSLKDA